MKLRNIRLFLPVVTLGIVLLSGCSKDEDSGAIMLNMEHMAGTEALVFDDMRYRAPSGHEFSVITLRYYISAIRLHAEGGGEVPFKHILYRDARRPETNNVLLGELPNGRYTSLSFVFGLDAETNVTGGLANTVENSNMEWPVPMGGGYHYMKFEGRYKTLAEGEIQNFNLHTGATDGNQNFIAVTMPIDLRIDGNDWEIDLVMNLMEWLQNPNTWDFEEFGPAIMGNQQAQTVLRENGSTVFSVRSINKQ